MTDALYADFLGRAADSSGEDYWSSRLVNGQETRRSVAGQFARSDEWLVHIVDRLYVDTLGRPADAGGRSYWVDQLRSGRSSVAGAASSFYASDEYVARVGGTNEAWVHDLYAKLLGRNASDQDVTYWSARAQQVGRPSVASQLFQSIESRRRRVTALYQALLGRDPDAGGREYWAGRVLNEGDIALAIELASSDEYLARARARFPH